MEESDNHNRAIAEGHHRRREGRWRRPPSRVVFYTAEKAEKVPGKSNTEHGVVLRRRRNWPRRVDKEGGVAENKRQKPMGNSVFSQRWHKWQNSNNGVLLLPMRRNRKICKL